MTEQILVSLIRIDGGTQPRAQLSYDVVTEYYDAMLSGSVFPPVEVFYDGTTYWLVDGFHRVAAVKRTSQQYISANITQGTLADAQWRSLSVNQTHGLRRTTADKQRAIETALRHPLGVGKSDRSIADYLGVSHPTVAKIRVELTMTGKIYQSDQRVGQDGRTINTTNIGKAAPIRYTADEFSQADPDDDDADAIDYPTYDDDAIDHDDPDPVIDLGSVVPAWCGYCEGVRDWRMTTRKGVDLAGACGECHTVATYHPDKWLQLRAAALHPSADELSDDQPAAVSTVPPRTWPADIPVYCIRCRKTHAEWKSVGDAWLCGHCRDIRLADTMPALPVPLPPSPNGEGPVVRFSPKWNPGVRVMCAGCNEAHADWIARPGDSWICRKCGVIRANDTMEEWTPADRHTPNYHSPNGPRVNNNTVIANMLSSTSNEWYTPSIYIEAARVVMGGIDLDPASCALANETVMADRYFDQAADGLSHDWHGCVWLNPPYGKNDDNDSNQGLWTKYLIDQYSRRCLEQAVLLVNAVPERSWFKPLFDYPVCFTDHRIKFYNDSGVSPNSTIGNAFVYFGPYVSRFIQEFSAFGTVVRAVRS